MFWNLGKNRNEKLLKDIIIENSIDLLILSEFQATDISHVISELKDEYCLHEGYGGCKKVVMIARKNADIRVCREQCKQSSKLHIFSPQSAQFYVIDLRCSRR